MIVKDAEAPEYECPQAIISDNYVYCRGSRCMAWRWAYDKVLKTTDDPDAPALERFCARVEAGEIRSRNTYAEFKTLLEEGRT